MEMPLIGPTGLVLAQILHLDARQVERGIYRFSDTYPKKVREDFQIPAFDLAPLRPQKSEQPADPRAKQPDPAGALESTAHKDIAADLGAIRNQCITFFHFQPRAPAIKITIYPRAWQPDRAGGCETLAQKDIAADHGAFRKQRISFFHVQLCGMRRDRRIPQTAHLLLSRPALRRCSLNHP